MKKVILLTVFFTISIGFIAKSQSHIGGLLQLLEKSDVIIEGQVLSKTFVQDEKKGTVYTHNHVKVFSKIKGEVESSLIVRTEGGQIDNFTQVVTQCSICRKRARDIFINAGRWFIWGI